MNTKKEGTGSMSGMITTLPNINNKKSAGMYVVREDGIISSMDVDEEEIMNMIGSDYFSAVFRLTELGIEYADVDLIKGMLEWKNAIDAWAISITV